MYISLHNHSCYSIFDGYSKIDQMVQRAKSLGQHSIAITEHCTMSSIIPFYKECHKQGINPVLGNEFYFCPTVTVKERSQTHHLILLAKTRVGYKNLLTLTTLAFQNMFYKPRIDIDMLREHHEGIICLSACMASILNTDNAEYWAKEFRGIFGKDFYCEIQANSMDEQKVYNKKIIDLSRKLEIPLVITSDAHYPTKADAKYHKLWVNLNKGENNYYPTEDFWIKGESDIRHEMSQELSAKILDEAISNTDKIAHECQVDITVEGDNFPVFPCDDMVETVKNICRSNWKTKVGSKVSKAEIPKYVERFNYEMKVLEQCNYLNYLLITQDLLEWCMNHKILTGIGRGSCGGSLVCYLMNITKLDPIKYNLMFERFVNPERVSPADKLRCRAL